MPEHTPPRGIFFLGKMKILGKKMVFTAEKRGGRGVCAADPSQPEQSMSCMSHLCPLPSFVCVLSTKIVAHSPSANFLRHYHLLVGFKWVVAHMFSSHGRIT